MWLLRALNAVEELFIVCEFALFASPLLDNANALGPTCFFGTRRSYSSCHRQRRKTTFVQMNKDAVDRIFNTICARVEAEKTSGATEFDFSGMFIALGPDWGPAEREELQKRCAANGWKLDEKSVFRIK